MGYFFFQAEDGIRGADVTGVQTCALPISKEYGLEHVGYSTQALFFDYDGDGDLDMYLLDHSTHTQRAVENQPQRGAASPRTGDRLFRNDGGHFTDVTAAAGLHDGIDGYGL